MNVKEKISGIFKKALVTSSTVSDERQVLLDAMKINKVTNIPVTNLTGYILVTASSKEAALQRLRKSMIVVNAEYIADMQDGTYLLVFEATSFGPDIQAWLGWTLEKYWEDINLLGLRDDGPLFKLNRNSSETRIASPI